MATNPEEIIQAEAPDASTIEGAVARMRATREEDTAVEEEVPEVQDDGPVEHPEETAEEENVAPLEEADVVEEDLVEEEDFRPTFEPPRSWSEDAKEAFQALPDDLKEQIVEKDKAVERGVHKKLQETANIRKQLEAEAERLTQLRADYQSRLESLQGQQTVELPAESLLDPESDDYDPDTYNRQMARYVRQKETNEKHQVELQKLRQEEERKRQDALLEAVRESEAKLLHRFPSWKDESKAKEGIESLRSYLVKQGIEKQVAYNVYDADMLTITWKAKRYDEMRAKQGVQPKAVQKQTRPTSRAAVKSEAGESVKKLRSNLKETGSIEDAVALMRATRT